MTRPTPGSTVGAARRALAGILRDHHIESPDADTRILIGHALGLDHSGLAAAEQRTLTVPEGETIGALAARRIAGEPVARIRGHKEFWSLDFLVTPAVLVPRPETETVVEAALDQIGPARRNAPLRLLDIGTGSGALLVALLKECSAAHGVATDRSVAALKVARENANRNGVGPRADFVACDYGSALCGGYDIVVTNPPYIRSGDIAGLAREVRDHDPQLALDGGPDGLDAYRAIAADAERLLRPGGSIVAECGFGQVDAVTALFVAAGLSVPQPARADLAGVPRALVAIREG